MNAYIRPISAAAPIVTATGLLALGSAPVRPSQPQCTRAGREWQGDFQQSPHLWDAQFGQFRVWVFPPPLGEWMPTRREPSLRV
jgi:hypothetical protein